MAVRQGTAGIPEKYQAKELLSVHNCSLENKQVNELFFQVGYRLLEVSLFPACAHRDFAN